MRIISHQNFAAPEPDTPLCISEPVHYVRCNLLNRRVHPDSIVEGCQVSQILIDKDPVYKEKDAEPFRLYVRRGVIGQIPKADLTAATTKFDTDAAAYKAALPAAIAEKS